MARTRVPDGSERARCDHCGTELRRYANPDPAAPPRWCSAMSCRVARARWKRANVPAFRQLVREVGRRANDRYRQRLRGARLDAAA